MKIAGESNIDKRYVALLPDSDTDTGEPADCQLPHLANRCHPRKALKQQSNWAAKPT